MDEQKQYTEEEVRRRERQAFVHGAEWNAEAPFDMGDAERAARVEFPIKKKVPRVEVDDTGLEWRLHDGELEWRRHKPSSTAFGWQRIGYGADRLRVWENLRQNPTVEVDE